MGGLTAVARSQESVEVEVNGIKFTLQPGERQNYLISAINTLKGAGLFASTREMETPTTVGCSHERVDVEFNGFKFTLRSGVGDHQDQLIKIMRAALTNVVRFESTDGLEVLHQQYIADRAHISGSFTNIVGLDTVQPFIFNWWELKLELERFSPSHSSLNISDDLIEIADFPIGIDQIHLGEFWCEEGFHWVDATEDQWGIDVSRSCLLHRDLEQ